MEEKKYIVLVGDGMADLPIPELGNKTILEYANIPNMNYLASKGITGLTNTVPEGMSPGSDTANLSIFGYDPVISFTGRAPLEALSMDVNLGPEDTAFRCNIINSSDNIMKDFTASHIDSMLSEIVIKQINRRITKRDIEFYPGVSYRNLMVWRNYPYKNIADTVPPHDIQGKEIQQYLPSGEGSDELNDLMKRARKIIASSSDILKAMKKFQGNPESIWLWGGGKKPKMKTLKKRFGLYGYTISAVDLIHGIGKAAGLEPIEVDGATGYIDTNYEGKASALISSIKKCNYVFLHVEAPDESGHEGSIEKKLKSVEDFDKRVVGPVIEEMEKYSNFSILLMPDHHTPVSVKTHTSDPVPFCIYSKGNPLESDFKKFCASSYSEKTAEGTGFFVKSAHQLIEIMTNESI
jgi:2,3-bisphosphoglycerate-independent phosphoglycerate mutase